MWKSVFFLNYFEYFHDMFSWFFVDKIAFFDLWNDKTYKIEIQKREVKKLMNALVFIQIYCFVNTTHDNQLFHEIFVYIW